MTTAAEAHCKQNTVSPLILLPLKFVSLFAHLIGVARKSKQYGFINHFETTHLTIIEIGYFINSFKVIHGLIVLRKFAQKSENFNNQAIKAMFPVLTTLTINRGLCSRLAATICVFASHQKSVLTDVILQR